MAACEQCLNKVRRSGAGEEQSPSRRHFECFFCLPAWDEPSSLCDKFVFDLDAGER